MKIKKVLVLAKLRIEEAERQSEASFRLLGAPNRAEVGRSAKPWEDIKKYVEVKVAKALIEKQQIDAQQGTGWERCRIFIELRPLSN